MFISPSYYVHHSRSETQVPSQHVCPQSLGQGEGNVTHQHLRCSPRKDICHFCLVIIGHTYLQRGWGNAILPCVGREKRGRTFGNIFSDYHGDLSTSGPTDLPHSTTVKMYCKWLNQCRSSDNTSHVTMNVLSHLSLLTCFSISVG